MAPGSHHPVLETFVLRPFLNSYYNSLGEEIPDKKLRASFSRLSLPKMLSGANAFEINDIDRMNIGAHQP